MLFEIKARLDAGIVLVADDDQCGQRHALDVVLELVKRRTAALKTALGVRRALRIVLGQRIVKFLETARVLYQKRNPPRAHAGNPCDDIGVALLELLGVRHGLIAKTLQAFFLETRTDAGQRQRARALRRL